MDDKPNSSWDELIRQVGAAPPPDALERERPAVTAKFDPPPIAAPPAAAKPSDWGALASELGVEATEPPPPPPSRSAPRAADKPASQGDLEASFAGIEPLESDFEEVVETEMSEIDFVEADDSDLEDESADLDFDDPDALSGDAARSAFEALFQAGSFSSLPATPRPPREPDESRRRPPRPASRREATSARDDDADSNDARDEGRQALEGEQPVESGEEGRPRRRRRRGRGRGRGRDRDDADRSAQAKDTVDAGDVEGEDELADALHDEGDAAEREAPAGDAEESRERPRRKRGRRRRRSSGEPREGVGDTARPVASNGRAPARPSAEGDEDDEDDEDDDEPLMQADDGDEGDDDELAAGSRRASHKNIPTWSDAIGVMVETNMQSRKNSPQRPSTSRERGRGGRGRGRGGRPRGKP